MNKRLLLATIVVAALLGGARAETVTPAMARQAAAAWAAANPAFGTGAQVVGDVRAEYDTNAAGTLLWYQVSLSNPDTGRTACLVVSPVTELEPVVAALGRDPGELPAGHPLRALLTRDLRARLRLLGLYSDEAAATPAAAPGVLKAAALKTAAAASTDVTPDDPNVAAWCEEGRGKWRRLGVKGRSGAVLKAAARVAAADGEGEDDDEEEVDPKTIGADDVETEIYVLPGFEEGGKYTHWDQGEDPSGAKCYNLHTPSNSVCGCVATTMAAILQYFSATGCAARLTSPRGLIRETQDGVYGPSFNGFPIIEDYSTFTIDAYLAGEFPLAEFCVTRGGPYKWSLLDGLESVDDYASLSSAQRGLLGTVTHDAGVGVAMQWSKGVSGAYEADMAPAFTNLFGFVEARAVRDPDGSQYAKLIYNQCRAGAPVALGIASSDPEAGIGHSVLAVGYGLDDEGTPRVRVFVGWGGLGDAWYALPYITTSSVAGGASYDFDLISEVITLLGPENDETVPVVGRLTYGGEPVADAEITLPGVIDKEIVESGSYEDDEGNTVTTYTTNTFRRVIKTDADGYFGTRVSPRIADTTLEYGGQKASFTVDAAALKAASSASALADALPGAIDFRLMNSSVAYSFEEAIEKALAENKAILRVSATTDGGVSEEMLDILTQMDADDEDGFTGKFVYYFSDYAETTSAERDLNPSVAVFLPQEASVDERWYWANGRLAYAYFADEDDDGDGDDEEEDVETRLRAVLDDGYTAFLQRTSGIVLTVAATATMGDGAEPDFGVYTDCYADGETVVATAPAELTNAVVNATGVILSGVVMGCDGWVLTDDATGAEVASGDGTSAEFAVAADTAYTLTWTVVTNAVYIRVSDRDSAGLGQTGGRWGTTSPGSGWYAYGESVTFTATPNAGRHFAYWRNGDGAALPSYVEAKRTKRTLTISPLDTFALDAYYETGAATDDDEDDDFNYTFAVEWADTLDNLASGNGNVLAAAADLPENFDISQVVVTSVPTGWKLTGVEQNAAGDLVAVLEVDEDALAPAAASGAAAPIVIVRNDDGETYTVKSDLSNAAKGFWYSIQASADLKGTYAPVKSAQATADGAFTVSKDDVDPGTDGTQTFYKLVVTESQP